MATPPIVPAVWYTDPVGRHEYRYWDGTDWKPEVSDGGVTAVDPLGPPPPPLLRPAGLVAGSPTTSSVAFRWAGPASGPPPDKYLILNDGKVIGSVPGTVTSYRGTGLAPATAYQFRVAAVLGGKRSALSSVLVVATSPRPCRRPAWMGGGRSASRLSRALRTSGTYPKATAGTNRGGSARGARPGLARCGSWAISAGSDSRRPSPARAPCIEGRRSATCFPADQARTRSPSGPR